MTCHTHPPRGSRISLRLRPSHPGTAPPWKTDKTSVAARWGPKRCRHLPASKWRRSFWGEGGGGEYNVERAIFRRIFKNSLFRRFCSGLRARPGKIPAGGGGGDSGRIAGRSVRGPAGSPERSSRINRNISAITRVISPVLSQFTAGHAQESNLERPRRSGGHYKTVVGGLYNGGSQEQRVLG